MKKILSIAPLMLMLITSLTFAQSTVPRFGTTKGDDNTGRVLTYGYISHAYAATDTINANAYETTVKIGQLTGAQTLRANVVNCHVGDKLNILFNADGTNRVVTFSTGFSSGGTTTIAASTSASLYYVFNGTGWFQLSGQNLVTGLVGNGSAAAPSISFTGQTDLGLYKVSSSDIGISVGGSKIGDITANGISLSGNLTTGSANIRNISSGTAFTATASVTAAQLAKGLLTITSGTDTLTLPTATLLATQLGAGAGSTFDFVLQNSASGGTALLVVGTGIVASGFPATNTLSLANSATVGIASFRITFLSATAATITRIN